MGSSMFIRVSLIVSLAVILAGCGTAEELGRTPQSGASPATATPKPTLVCTTTSGSVAAIPSVRDLTWASYRIVIGSVQERLPSVPDPKAPQQPLYTDYVIKVARVYRGAPIDTVRIRRGGGQIRNGCTDPENGPALEVGDRFLLFLNFPQAGTDVPTYAVTGDGQGYWRLDASDIVTEAVYSQFDGRSVAEVAQEIARALAGPPPTQPIAAFIPVVPLTAAPPGPALPTVSTPSP